MNANLDWIGTSEETEESTEWRNESDCEESCVEEGWGRGTKERSRWKVCEVGGGGEDESRDEMKCIVV